jgi:hypothetical protein
MKTRIAVAAIAALFCVSCIPVPFDLALSQSAAAVKKMTRDNSDLLTMENGTDPSARDFAFYPQVLPAPDYTNGFVVSRRNLELQIDAVEQSATPGRYSRYSGQSFTIANPDPRMPPFAAWPVKTGSSYLLVMTFDALDPFNANRYMRFWGDAGTGNLIIQNGPNTRMYDLVSVDPGILNLAVIGASVYAGAAGDDYMHWLGKSTSVSDNYIELGYSINSGGLGASTKPRGLGWYNLSFIPDSATRVAYFYDPDPSRFPHRSFASWWDSGNNTWVCYAWEGPVSVPPTAHMQLPINHRLDALLSTGQLLSTEDGIGRLYSRDGDLKATFPLGNLVYLGEHFVGGVPRCYFSQSLVFDHTQHFNVYWIRTDELDTLDD